MTDDDIGCLIFCIFVAAGIVWIKLVIRFFESA